MLVEERIWPQTLPFEPSILYVPDAPAISGLAFRRFRGELDYAAMAAVIAGSKEADGIERVDTADDVARVYGHLTNCDPYEDMLFAEVDGSVIGYSRVWWHQQLDGIRSYNHFAFLLPQWRGQGIRRAMLRRNEWRGEVMAANHPSGSEQVFEAWAADTESHWESLLVSQGYEPARYGYDMVRPDLEDIPEMPLPEGIEVRPVPPEHYYTVWKAEEEAFRDHWGASEWKEEWFEEMLESPTFQPHLWQVAWDGDQVAGMVLNFIDEKENEEYKRKRGWTEDIAVLRPYRRQGLAKALIARSLRLHRRLGMTEAALGVDADNPNGALRLYQSMGFCMVKQHTTYRKPLV
jgi:mycothiol synthase